MRRTENFNESEWNCKCKHCNKQVPHNMDPVVMRNIQMLRVYMGRPLFITSAYRCPRHENEVDKETPGQHGLGMAVDIYVTNGHDAARILQYAIKYLGVKGWAYSKRLGFVHLDWRKSALMTWEY